VLPDLAGAVAASGPGSFTGLRVGLATLLGFHQALGIAVTGIPTLALLAAAAPPGRRIAAVVPAGPGEWFVQRYDTDWPPGALDEPRRVPVADLAALAPTVERLVTATDDEAMRLHDLRCPIHVAGPLAPVAARLASLHPPVWDASKLSAPLYLAPAPVSVPGAPKPVMPVANGTRS